MIFLLYFAKIIIKFNMVIMSETYVFEKKILQQMFFEKNVNKYIVALVLMYDLSFVSEMAIVKMAGLTKFSVSNVNP